MTENTIKLPVSGKEVKVKKLMSTKQVRDGRDEVSNLLEVATKLQNGERSEDLMTEILNKNKRQDEVIAETLLSCLGITQEDLDELAYIDGLVGYSKLFELSTTIPKN